jgi:hypothetical protein
MTRSLGPTCWCAPPRAYEAAYLLCSDDDEDGDCSESAGRDITWQHAEDYKDTTEPAVVLWSGEVLLNIGRGLAGPFYTHQSAAAAWRSRLG